MQCSGPSRGYLVVIYMKAESGLRTQGVRLPTLSFAHWIFPSAVARAPISASSVVKLVLPPSLGNQIFHNGYRHAR